jgi:hypothetical protein
VTVVRTAPGIPGESSRRSPLHRGARPLVSTRIIVRLERDQVVVLGGNQHDQVSIAGAPPLSILLQACLRAW